MIRRLDCGADSLMVPMFDTADHARTVVDTVRYACPVNHGRRLVIVMIETVEAIRHLEAILVVEWADVVFVAPGDPSRSTGNLPSVPLGQERSKTVQGAVRKQCSRQRGGDAGI